MKINQNSPWFLVYTAVASAIVVIVMYLIFSDEIDWFYVVLLPVAAVIGVLIGNRLRARPQD